MDETAPRDMIDSILKVQNQQIKLAGMLQRAGILSRSASPVRATATRTSWCASRLTRRCFVLMSRGRRGQCFEPNDLDQYVIAAPPIGAARSCESYMRGIDARIADWFISHCIRCMDRSPSRCAMARWFDLFSRHWT